MTKSAGRMRELLRPYARAFPPALLVMLSFVLIVELASFTTIGAAQGKKFSIGGHIIDTTAPMPWIVAFAALLLGGLWLRREARGFRERWDALMEGAKAESIKAASAKTADEPKIQIVKTQGAMS
jgi:branched-chain amino acid transport system permease protein